MGWAQDYNHLSLFPRLPNALSITLTQKEGGTLGKNESWDSVVHWGAVLRLLMPTVLECSKSTTH